jgi:hypothetical protein
LHKNNCAGIKQFTFYTFYENRLAEMGCWSSPGVNPRASPTTKALVELISRCSGAGIDRGWRRIMAAAMEPGAVASEVGASGCCE